MTSGTPLRLTLFALLAAVAVPARAAALSARALRAQVDALALGQISFEGLDLSDDGAANKSSNAKKNGKGKKAKRERGSTAGSGSAARNGQAERRDGADSSPPPAPSGNGAIEAPGLDLTAPTPPKAAEAPTKPAPMMSFEAIDVSGKSAERQRLDAAIKLFKDGGYEASALALQEVVRDASLAELHDEARYVLAKALYRMGLYHSSLLQFRTLLAKGPSNKYFRVCLEWLFYIAHKTVNEQVVLDEVAKWANQDFPERFRSEFRYLLARYDFGRGKALDEAGQPEEAKKSFAEALKLVLMVPHDDPFYGRVKYVEGAVLFEQGAFAQALESFKEVVRVNNPRVNPDADLKLRELAFMQLARTHYGHKQNRYAIFYYDKVSRGSDQWLEALFEASWAHFRVGEYERALGNLITLSSPFFKDEYFPEALILKAVIYYENCRYREARAILEEFERTYMPVHNELERITSTTGKDAQGYWDILAEVQKRNREGGRNGSVLLERILKLALTDKDLKAVNDSILEVEKEMDTTAAKSDAFKFSDLAKGSLDGLKSERIALMAKADILSKAKLEFELNNLKELLGQALRIKFETTTKEKEFLEAQLTSGGRKEVVRNYGYSVAVPDERLYWPYEGEYWRDELGTYEYTLTKGCKADH